MSKVISIPDKPKEPKYPLYKDYVLNSDFVEAYSKYMKEMEKYKALLEVYEQTKLIKFIKSADIKLILKKYKITKVV